MHYGTNYFQEIFGLFVFYNINDDAIKNISLDADNLFRCRAYLLMHERKQ